MRRRFGVRRALVERDLARSKINAYKQRLFIILRVRSEVHGIHTAEILSKAAEACHAKIVAITMREL